MSEQRQQNKNPQNPKRPKKRIRLAVTIIVIATIICCVFWKIGLWNLQSVDEQLAAIEATRAIPDSENAAIIYRQLLQDPNATSLLDYRPEFLDDESDNLTFRQPWSGKDFPQLGAWLKEQQPVIDRLFKASKFDKCRFPIAIAALPDHLTAMRKWTFLLKRAAYNDTGEGRIDDAIDKWRCLVQMGNHLRQQPLFDDLLVGIAIEAVALDLTAVFAVEGKATEQYLDTIESALALSPTTDSFSQDYATMMKVERLLQRKQSNLLTRVRSWWEQRSSQARALEKLRTIHLRLLRHRRGNRILIALRRCKSRTGDWPESLDKIQPLVAAEVLVDPSNNGCFVYKLTDDSFRLYSRGENDIDENGQYKGNVPGRADDWLIWPPRGRESKSKDRDADSAKASMPE